MSQARTVGGTLEPELEVMALGPLEAQVMNVLWDHGPQTVREVIGHLPSDPAYTTIATVLRNLERKEVVVADRDLERRSTHYSACVECCDLVAGQMAQVLAFSKDRRSSLQRFVECVSEEDLDFLRDRLGISQ